MTGVAVSGGADSIYLLHEMLGRGVRVTVLHVNHKLRGEESDADERFVRALGHPTLVLNGPPGTGNLEQAAREIRYGWFRRLVQQGVVDQVALGHTRSDQAETVLFRFLRGAGTAGLAGIRPETSGGVRAAIVASDTRTGARILASARNPVAGRLQQRAIAFFAKPDPARAAPSIATRLESPD